MKTNKMCSMILSLGLDTAGQANLAFFLLCVPVGCSKEQISFNLTCFGGDCVTPEVLFEITRALNPKTR